MGRETIKVSRTLRTESLWEVVLRIRFGSQTPAPRKEVTSTGGFPGGVLTGG